MYLYMGPAQSRSFKRICWMGEWDNFKTYIWSWAASTIFRKKSSLLCKSSLPTFNLELVDLLAFSLWCHNQQFMLCLTHSQPTPLLVLSLLSNTFLLIHQMWKFPLTLLQENDLFSISRPSHMLAVEFHHVILLDGLISSSGMCLQDRGSILLTFVSKDLMLCFWP